VPEPTRRQALDRLVRCWAGMLSAGLAVLEGCVPAATGRRPAPGVKVGTLDQLPSGAARRVVVRDEPVIVLNHEGTIRAFSGLCTHEACELGWNASQQLIRCPCHGSAFDPGGAVTKGPATDPLPELEVAVDRKGVYVGELKRR